MAKTAYAPDLDWTSTFHLSPASPPDGLKGDKLILPQSALESLLSAATISASAALNSITYDPSSWDTPDPSVLLRKQQQQQLPEPLMFNLVNVNNGKSTSAGIREFSAEPGEVILSSFLNEALGISDDNTQIQITSKTLPKGTYVRLRPLEAGYDEDWKSLLEDYLRRNFTTLTISTELLVPAIGRQTKFRFLVDKLLPEDAICIVDTDLEVDIEPLDEEQARESLKRMLAKKAGTSTGGDIAVDKRVAGTVARGAYVQYKLSNWDKTLPLRIELDDLEEGDEVDILVATSHLLQQPDVENWEWSNFDCKDSKTLVIEPNDERLKGGANLQIALYGYTPDALDDNVTAPFSLIVAQGEADIQMEDDATAVDADHEICSNCKQSIPKRTLFLHQNFCFRNNILCPQGCGQIFKRGIEVDHWHCTFCSVYGTNPVSGINTHDKHITIAHTPHICSACSYSTGSLSELAHHRTTTCPSKLILCKFCHLLLPQESPTDPAHAFLTTLTPHESHCGSRTTNCHICNRIIQLKQLDLHLLQHDHDRKSKPLPILCRNANCSRTVPHPQNELDLCAICFGSLYSPLNDPDHSQLARRVGSKLTRQLMMGCQKAWCRNSFCKTGRSHTGLPVIPNKEAAGMVKPLIAVEGLTAGYTSHPLYFCVDESTQKRRDVAERLSMEQDEDGKGGWSVEWCVKAIESVGNDCGGDEDRMREMGKGWLVKYAVRRGE